MSLRSACCAALVASLGAKISFPEDPVYQTSLASYFSPQESSISPQCIVSPVSADDVATTIKTLNVGGENCRFAIRSGGHMMNAGAANIADGVTIDLRGLDFVELDKDDNVVSIGPGATWREVYAKLDPLGLSTTGGRTASVGVGGLTVGGGISYFAPQKGWVCDNVRNFEVVLANGSIVNANKDENPDLLVALRGGANNFGVVTRLDLEVFEHGLMLGGQLIHDISVVPDQIDAFVQVNRADYDEHASLVAAWAYTPLIGVFAITHPVYTKPVQRPKVYEKIFSLPTLSSTVRITNLSNLTNELEAQQPPGSRQTYSTMTFLSTAEILNEAFSIWNSSIAKANDIENLVWIISFQPLPPGFYRRHAATNSLGLQNRSKNMVIVNTNMQWNKVEDDDKVKDLLKSLLNRLEDRARRLGVYDPFKYLNYAGAFQDPIASYGVKSLAHLCRTRKRFDPAGVFTNRVPGGYKLVCQTTGSVLYSNA